MSHLLGGLDVEHAQALVTQAQATEQVQAAPEVIESICELTNCHPYLLQQLCSRIFQPEGQLRPVEAADLSVDPLLAGFLSNDFNLLSEAEKRLVWTTHEQRQVSEAALAAARHEDVAELQAFLREIVPLGYLRRVDDRLLIGNRFLENWLTAERRRIGQEYFSSAQEGLPPAPLPIATGGRGTGPLVSQLNDKRARLVELEMIRARDLLQVAPEVLAEIRQTEQQIQRLLNVLKGDA
jgi:hypothetical protein